MKNISRCVPALLIGSAFAGAGPALAQTRQTYLDVSGGVGYASNAALQPGGDTDSFFVRLSANGVHAWQTERSSSRLSAFVEHSTYGGGNLDSKQIFDLNGDTSYAVSETVQLFGALGFSGDFGGQLSTRFTGPPSFPETPPVITPPPPLTPSDPELFGLTGRQYRLTGQIGAAVRPTEREQWSFAASASHFFFSGSSSGLDYWTYGGSAGYERQVSERSSVGLRLAVQRSEFPGGVSATVLNPQVTFRTRFSEVWDAQAAVGVSYSDEDRGAGSDKNWSLSLDGSLCRTFENDRLCARASRYSQPSATAQLVQTTSAGVDWSRRLGQRDNLQLSANVVRSSGLELLGVPLRPTYYTAAGSYSRQFSPRLSGGVFVNARKLTQAGPDPKADFSGSLFVTYRFGDIR